MVRRIAILLPCLCMILYALSCSENGSPPKNGQGSLPANGSRYEMPVIPPGAMYTIQCTEIGGADHVTKSKQLMEQLKALPEMRNMQDWHVLHTDSGSILRYGFYGDIHDPSRSKERDRINADLNVLKQMYDRVTQARLFAMCAVQALDMDDPPAPPEWNIANKKDAYWSVQIAALTLADRKMKAVEAVRHARAENIEAYFYHGPNVSSVLIGAWPKAAAENLTPEGGRASNSSKVVFVFYGLNLPNAVVRGPNGEEAEVLVPKLNIIDESMAAVLRDARFNEHSVNGFTRTRKVKVASGEVREIPEPAFVVQISQRGTEPVQTTNAQPGVVQPGVLPPVALPGLPNPVGGTGQGGGRLRSIDDK